MKAPFPGTEGERDRIAAGRGAGGFLPAGGIAGGFVGKPKQVRLAGDELVDLGVLENELGRALDRSRDRSVDRALRHVAVERALDLGAVGVCIDLEVVHDVHALDHDDAIVLGLDLARRLTDEATLACWDLTRLQRASERSGESAARRGNDVVERRGPLGLRARWDAVVLSDARVDAEHDRLCLDGNDCAPQRPANSLDPNVRGVDDTTHGTHARRSCGQ